MPNVKCCSNCKSKEEIDSFSFKQNGFICKTCAKQDTSSVHLSENTKCAIQYIVMSESKKIFSFNMPEDDLRELQLVAKIYFEEKLEKFLEK